MKRYLVIVAGLALAASAATADVTRLEHRSVAKRAEKSAKDGRALADRAAVKPHQPSATGSQALTDGSNFEYFINTDITFNTSSSASGAASEASYTGPVNADTSGGGTVSSTLNDAFDGYETICVSFDGDIGPCVSGGGGPGEVGGTVTMYNQNGPATLSCSGREVMLPTQAMGSLNVSRRVFVPTNDAFARWLNVFTNTGAVPVTFNMITGNNLGSDANTTIVTTSDGDATVETTDTWATTFQNWSGSTSSDPRLGHVFQGPGAAVSMAGVSFANGDDNPFWYYTITLQPGQTGIIMNFVTGQPTRAAAAAKAAELVGLPDTTATCMSTAEQAQVLNFAATQPSVIEVPTLSGLGLAALASLLALGSLLLLRRRSA